MKHKFKDLLEDRARDYLGLKLSDRQIEQCQSFYELLMEWNELMNLTAITEALDVVDKHFLDSFLFLPYLGSSSGQKLIDIGSGAGFPGIPIAILRPDLKIVCMDSLKKRTQFLEQVLVVCELENVKVIHGRSELLAKNSAHRDRYQLATARAVARLPVLLEYAMPFLAPQGKLIAGKGPDLYDEIIEAGPAAQALKAELISSVDTALPQGDARSFAIYVKTAATPKAFPRKPGDAKRQPIGS